MIWHFFRLGGGKWAVWGKKCGLRYAASGKIREKSALGLIAAGQNDPNLIPMGIGSDRFLSVISYDFSQNMPFSR